MNDNRRSFLWLVLPVSCLLSSAGCDKKNAPTGTPGCETIEQCDKGALCTSGECLACRSTDECATSPEYGDAYACNRGDCVVFGGCAVGSENCPCLLDGGCAPGLECVEDACVLRCPVDQIRDGTTCRDAVGCEKCQSRRRECLSDDSSAGTAECGDCFNNHRPVSDSVACVIVPTCNVGDTGSIAALCAAQGRSCLPLEAGAECGKCVDSYVEIAHICEPRVTCAELSCENENRLCEDEPNGRCAGCEDYFVEEAGVCRDVLTCASAPCREDDTCTEATAISDRECQPSIGGCSPWQVPHHNGVSCVRCPVPCTQVTGSDGTMVPEAFQGTQCLCATAEGYFISPGENGGAASIVACDADGDGWVRDTLLGLQK